MKKNIPTNQPKHWHQQGQRTPKEPAGQTRMKLNITLVGRPFEINPKP